MTESMRKSVRRPWTVAIGCTTWLLLGACTSATDRLSAWATGGWLADYDTAEARAVQTGDELLIYFQNNSPRKSGSIDTALQDESVTAQLGRYVRCSLSSTYEPDRRYVAQYGVSRAPALVVVHPDGTYHARTGSASAEEIRAFLDGAVPPGRSPSLNPFIPRRANFSWSDSLEEGVEFSKRSGRPLLVVYYRSLSRDWTRLDSLLADSNAVRQLAGMIPVRIALGGWKTEAYITPFGALHLPALVIAHTDRTFDVLEKPTSSEMIARFAVGAMEGGGVAPSNSAASQSP